MNFDFGEVLTRAFQITWKNKILWLFSALPTLVTFLVFPIMYVPGLGKSYLRARQHRDLVSILPNGSRVYEFHPWDKNIFEQKNYIGTDVPILDYLERLKSIGEKIEDYETIWYYY